MRITSKGQVTIPKHIRERAGMRPGTEVEFAVRHGLVVVMPVAEDRSRSRALRELDDYLEGLGAVERPLLSADALMELTRGPHDDVNPD